MNSTLGKLIGSTLVLVLSPLVRGFVLMWYWRWFVVGHFAIQALSFAQSVGLSLVIGLVFFPVHLQIERVDTMVKAIQLKPDDTPDWAYSLGFLLIVYPMAFGIGWIWHLVLP